MPPCLADEGDLQGLANALRRIADILEGWTKKGLPQGNAHPEIAAARKTFEAIATHLSQSGNVGQNLNRETVLTHLRNAIGRLGG
jgi:hypothetical protein